MKNHSQKLVLELSKSDFVQLFKACEDRQAKLDALQRQSDDEDVVADAGNDLIEINMVARALKQSADQLWGETGWTTSDDYI